MAVSSDIQNIMLLENACFNEFTQESEIVYLERIECFPQGFIILEDSGTFIGAVSSEIWVYNPVISVSTFSLGHSIKQQFNIVGNELYISSLGILPEHRNRGYGKALFYGLIDNIKKHFERVLTVILLVNEKWTFAQKIYIQNGFREITRFEDFFTEEDGSKSSGVVMRHSNIARIQNN